MSATFLSPDPSAPTPARSPLLDAALAMGGAAEIRAGWEVVGAAAEGAVEAAACRETVGFADVSDLVKVEVQRSRPTEGFEPSRALRVGGVWRCPVRPDRELILGSPGAEVATAADHGAGGRLCDLTASLAAIVIAGPAARECFARFCALDLRPAVLPVGGFRPGSIARTPGFLLREGQDRFLTLFGAAYAQHLWETVADAASALGGRPVAAAALPPIGEASADA